MTLIFRWGYKPIAPPFLLPMLDHYIIYIDIAIVLLLIHCYLVYLHGDLKFDTHLEERLNDYSLRLKDGASVQGHIKVITEIFKLSVIDGVIEERQ